MQRIEDFMTHALRVIAVIGALCLLAVACLSVIDISVREASGRPLHWAHDISTLLIIVIVAACFPAGLMERRQIKVTIIEGFVGPRANRIMRLVAELLTVFMFVCMAWYLTQYAIKVDARDEVSMVMGLPVAPFWWVATGLFWVCIPAQLLIIVMEFLGRGSAQYEA